MNVVEAPCGHREGCLCRSIAETEGIIPGQQLHIEPAGRSCIAK